MYCRNSVQCLVFCFVILSLVGCEQNPQRKSREQEKENRQEAAKKLEERATQVLTEFQTRYNADGTWQGSFKRSPVWTMDVQDRLIPADGRPVLSTGSLHDVKRKGGDYVLHFKKGFAQGLLGRYALGGVDMDFILKCSLPEDKRTEPKDVGEQISARTIGNLGNLQDEYAFVAKIHTIERSDRLIAQVTGDERLKFIRMISRTSSLRGNALP